MTNDLEQRLRTALDDDAMRAPRVAHPPYGLHRDARRRQRRSAALGGTALLAVVALAFAGLQLLPGDVRFAPQPGQQHDRPVFERTATILGFTVTAPSDWYLVDHWPAARRLASELGDGRQLLPVLELTNFDPGLGHAVCDVPAGTGNPLPPGGVAIHIAVVGDGTYDDDADMCGGNSIAETSGVRGSDTRWEMSLAIGDGVSDDLRAQAESIWRDVRSDAQDDTFQLPRVETPGFVLWGGRNDDGSTWTIEARPSEQNISLSLLERAADDTYSERGFADFTVPPNDVEGSYMGVVDEDAERVEFRSDDGSDLLIAEITDLPPSLGYAADAFHFPGLADFSHGELTAVMSAPDAEAVPGGSAQDRIVVAEGTDLVVGPWTLEVSTVDQGDGLGPQPVLGVAFERGGGGDGSIFPLEGATFGSYSIGTMPVADGTIGAFITGNVTTDASRVVFEPAGGDPQLDASLFPLPERFAGPSLAVLLVIDDAPRNPRGTLVAYGLDGRELDRVWISLEDTMRGVTPEIDRSLHRVQVLADAIGGLSVGSVDDALATLDLEDIGRRLGVDVVETSTPGSEQIGYVVEDEEHLVFLVPIEGGGAVCLGVELPADLGMRVVIGADAATTFGGCEALNPDLASITR